MLDEAERVLKGIVQQWFCSGIVQRLSAAVASQRYGETQGRGAVEAVAAQWKLLGTGARCGAT
eukprot:770566-Amphidinium_carterae.2